MRSRDLVSRVFFCSFKDLQIRGPQSWLIGQRVIAELPNELTLARVGSTLTLLEC